MRNTNHTERDDERGERKKAGRRGRARGASARHFPHLRASSYSCRTATELERVWEEATQAAEHAAYHASARRVRRRRRPSRPSQLEPGGLGAGRRERSRLLLFRLHPQSRRVKSLAVRGSGGSREESDEVACARAALSYARPHPLLAPLQSLGVSETQIERPPTGYKTWLRDVADQESARGGRSRARASRATTGRRISLPCYTASCGCCNFQVQLKRASE